MIFIDFIIQDRNENNSNRIFKKKKTQRTNDKICYCEYDFLTQSMD